MLRLAAPCAVLVAIALAAHVFAQTGGAPGHWMEKAPLPVAVSV